MWRRCSIATKLLQGNVINGPAIIEEVASTTVVEPGDTVTVNAYRASGDAARSGMNDLRFELRTIETVWNRCNGTFK